MEIFQTIWTVLTSENESLTKLIISPLTFLEAYLYMMLFITILKISCTKKQKTWYTITFAIIAIINFLFIPSPYYTFINVLACPILVFIIFKLNVINSILCEVVTYIFTFIIITPLILIYTVFLDIPSSTVNAVPLQRIIYSIFFYIAMFLLYKTCAKYTINISMLNKLKKNISYPLLINFILGTLAMAIQCYLEFLYIDYIPASLIVLSIVVLFLYFIISFYSLYRTNTLEATTEKLEKEKLYNQTLGLLYDNIRGFKHDFNNIVQGIGGYISTNNMGGLKEYYSQILDDCQKVNNLSLLSPEVINNPAIYSILASKYHTANELGIKVNIEVFMDLSNINMKIYELTRVIGILLDNAIEASKLCEEKEINITIRKDVRANKQLFIIENTYLNKDVNIDEIFEKGKTSKTKKDAKNHGLGLWEVRNLVKKRRNLNLYTTKDEKYFKQQFEIYSNKV